MVKIIDLGIHEIDVYDIEAENTHRFFANDILVHNSVYLNCNSVVEKMLPANTPNDKIVEFLDLFVERKLQPVVNSALTELSEKMNVFQSFVSFKREAIAQSALWTKKKRYILNVLDNEGVRYKEPQMKVTGLEVKRSSVPEICRNALKECYHIILENDEESLRHYVEDFRKKFYNSSFYDIAFPRGINGVEKYFDSSSRFKSKCPIHVKGALVYNEWISANKMEEKYSIIRDGDKIKFSYIKTPNRLKSEVLSCLSKVPDELKIQTLVDYDLQFEKAFLEPLNAVLRAAKLNISIEPSLEDIF